MAVRDAVVSNLVTAQDVPLELLELSYQNRLRVLGRLIDEYGFHTITLVEISEGFVLRASRRDEPWPQLLEFTDRQLAEMLRRSIQARGEGEMPRDARDLLPSGYEDFLRALGFELDQRVVESIVVTELPSVIAVTGFEPVIGIGEATYRPFSDAMGVVEVNEMLNRALSRRGTFQHIQTYIPPNFRG